MTSLRRTFWLLPLLMLLFAWVGFQAGPGFAPLKEGVRDAEKAWREDTLLLNATSPTPDQREAYAAHAPLYNTAKKDLQQFKWGGALFGAFIGFILAIKFFSLLGKKKRTCYDVDRVLCVSCGRCYLSCPLERQRLRQIGATDLGTIPPPSPRLQRGAAILAAMALLGLFTTLAWMLKADLKEREALQGQTATEGFDAIRLKALAEPGRPELAEKARQADQARRTLLFETQRTLRIGPWFLLAWMVLLLPAARIVLRKETSSVLPQPPEKVRQR